VRCAGAGLELRGFPQQARDAFHLHFDCSAGDAPLVSAAHGAIRPCGRKDSDATRDALLIRFVRAAFVLLPAGVDAYLFVFGTERRQEKRGNISV
jgi:hypothetical protein